MRILLITHRYPPLGVTGVERLSEQTALALTAAGHQVTVLTRDDAQTPPFPTLRRTAQRGVSVAIIAGGGSLIGLFPKHAPLLERLFERTLLEVAPDVVLISHLINHSPTYVSIARRWGVPVVVELHDFYIACERAHLQRVSGELCDGPEGGKACATYCFPQGPRALERWALRSHLFRHALEQADALICPTRFVENYFRRISRPPMPSLHVIGNGVDVGPPSPVCARPPDGRLHLAYVGVIAEHKGIHVLLEAVRLARLPSVRVTLIGDYYPPYLRELRSTAERIESLELRGYGRFEPVELPTLLADVDAVIVPSLVWETYSIVTHEAMACGVPVIASRLGALPEAVRHGQNGLLFAPGSAVDLATLLQMIDADRGLLKALRAGIRPTDWITVGQRTRALESVLEMVANRTPPVASDMPELEELSILRDSLVEGSASR